MRLVLGSVLLALSALTGCSTANHYYNPAKPHHTPQGFQNHDPAARNNSLADFLRWRWQAWRQNLPPAPSAPTPAQAPDFSLIAAASQARLPGIAAVPPSITWIGHASMLVQAGRLNMLTDPVFSERTGPSFLGPRRAQAPGLSLAELPPIDVVLITHNHYDHLDEDSVTGLVARAQASGASSPLFIVPLGLKPWLAQRGIDRVVELDWWDRHEHAGSTFYLTPAQHWSARSLTDRNQTLWGGFAVFSSDFHWFYSGDTGYSPDFSAIRAGLAGRHVKADQAPGVAEPGFDLAMIPVGAYEPRWFMQKQHVNPAEALQIHRDVGARRSVGVHWGTFSMTDEALDQPPKDLAAARGASGLTEDDFFLMKIGETRQFSPRRSP